ncbi:hypothetical protein DBV08_18125 [Rhodococcus sp. KBW08]|uniref:hypothetical protein n=1 Tax=Rhodococcus sp. KBW08 TaxID=2144188 RepID=UPI000FA0F59D|nr:hypothetical protein [Rhodococcus sp. KBW08]RQO46067.1 hypothetical protein DBV08_18125 [Rhodococcus sp. KBW08]
MTLVMLFVQGALLLRGRPDLISQVLLYAADGAPTLGGSFATIAFNVGAARGPALGGLAIGNGTELPRPARDWRRTGDTRDRHRRGHLVSVAATSFCPRIRPA